MKKRVNYDFERRKKEQERQRKKEAKLQRKQQSSAEKDDSQPANDASVGHDQLSGPSTG